MRLVVDASTLVSELLRDRGLVLLASPYLELYVPDRMWDETRHELAGRLEIRVSRGLPKAVAARYMRAAEALKEQSITEVPEGVYARLRDEALARLPRDPDDWQVVALALKLGADILAGDNDYSGCGVATWTVDTLIAQLERRGQSI